MASNLRTNIDKLRVELYLIQDKADRNNIVVPDLLVSLFQSFYPTKSYIPDEDSEIVTFYQVFREFTDIYGTSMLICPHEYLPLSWGELA